MDPSIHLEERRDRRGRRIPALAFIGVIVLLGAALVGLFGFLEANAAFGTVQDLEQAYICDVDDYELDFPEIGRLSEVYTADGVLLGKLTERNSQPVPLEDVPDTVLYALLAAEDADYYEHEGIDFRAILRAALENTRGTGGLQGGSTITQQVVKQNFLSNEQTIERKICEAVVAAELERTYSKDQILEFYMNSVFYGQNAYGVKAAASEYYGKELDELTVAEAASIVTPIRNPSRYDLRNRAEDVLRARNNVIDQMEENAFITATEAEAARNEPLAPIEHEEFEELSPQVMIAAREELLRDPKYGLGDTFSQRKQTLFGCAADNTECEGGGGLKVFVTVDFSMQQRANEILQAWFEDSAGPTGAIAMVDNRTGAVKVMASGLEFGEDIESGQRPYDLATKGRRQAGSAFKPFALAAALEHGSQFGWPITLGTYWDYTSPQEIPCEFGCPNNIWRVFNAGGANAGGIRTLEEATVGSYNTVYAQVSYHVGPENIVDTAQKMGIDSPLNPVLSIALGVEAVSPLEMAAAYSTFANYGIQTDSYLIERIEDGDGNVIYRHDVDQERVLDEALAAAAVSAMRQVVSGGTATRAQIGRPQAGKTGTAQNFRDVWFMGYIPQYTTAVWVGYPDAQVELVNFSVWDDLNQRDQHYSRAFGGTLAAPIWKQFMLYVTEELPIEDFPPEPEGTSVYRRVPSTEVPDVSGLVEENEITDLVFKAGLNVVFEDIASFEPEGTILLQTPGPGTTVRQGSSVTIQRSTGIAPTLPKLLGLKKPRAIDRLHEFNELSGLQLTWSFVDSPTDIAEDWKRVVAVGTASGTDEVSFGESITVFIGRRPGSAEGSAGP